MSIKCCDGLDFYNILIEKFNKISQSKYKFEEEFMFVDDVNTGFNKKIINNAILSLCECYSIDFAVDMVAYLLEKKLKNCREEREKRNGR